MGKKITTSKEELVDLYVVQRLSRQCIAKKLNIHESSVKKQLIKHNIPLRLSNTKNFNSEQLQKLYIDDNKTLGDIAKELASSPRHIRLQLIKNDIPLRKDGTLHRALIDKDVLIELYHIQDMSVNKIAEYLSVCNKTVARCLKEYKITIEHGSLKKQTRIPKTVHAVIVKDYESGMSAQDLATRYNSYPPQVYKILHANNVELRYDYNLHGVSKGESEVYEYICSLLPGVEVQQSNRDVLDGKEIDILIPSMNIGFEYHGLYWHCEQFTTSEYHLNKTTKCEEKGVRLIQIFEDEWKLKTGIVKNKIKSILGKATSKVYARKCSIIQQVSTQDRKALLESCHIQGDGGGSINIGLTHQDKLVAVMNFLDLGNNQYKLNRFASNTHVVGGFSKLLKYFIKTYNPLYIETFADLRWSSINSNVYNTNGFTLGCISAPNYYYTKTFTYRESRQKYMKSKLSKKLDTYDSNLTEYENMNNNGYYRIWDCGNAKYIWNKQP